MKKLILLLLVVCLGGLGAWLWWSRQPGPSPSNHASGVITPETSPETAQNGIVGVIVVAVPHPFKQVASPLTISGQARGTWFFEASAPVQLVDESGTVLAESFIEAQGEWMTEEFVEFSGEVIFDPGRSKTGTLILQNDNPSGLPENALALQIPVRFE